jgi:predicted lipoprotein with Yx(FWY)xxD motif
VRKGGWTAAAGLGSLALLLVTACGSSSSPTAASTSAPASSPASSSSTTQSSSSTSSPASSPATAPSSGNATASAPSQSPGPQASSGLGAGIPKGTTVLIVQHSKLGYVLAEANGQVVYTYAHDTKGGTPTCTGSCASLWLPVTGSPMAANGEHVPGTFGVVTRSDGTKQVTYNGYPLYTYSGAAPLSTHAIPGVWNVVLLSSADLG